MSDFSKLYNHSNKHHSTLYLTVEVHWQRIQVVSKVNYAEVNIIII